MYKFHKQNTNFQIAYFIAGSYHTPDAAYIGLLELAEERQRALEAAEVGAIKAKAHMVAIRADLKSEDEYTRLSAEARHLEYLQAAPVSEVLIAAAKEELKFIQQCINKIKPLMKYADRTDAEIAELAQREEWKYELINRAINSLLTISTIPTDQFATMRMHPDFETAIYPAIMEVRQAISLNKAPDMVLAIAKKHTPEPMLLLA